MEGLTRPRAWGGPREGLARKARRARPPRELKASFDAVLSRAWRPTPAQTLKDPDEQRQDCGAGKRAVPVESAGTYTCVVPACSMSMDMHIRAHMNTKASRT